MPITVAYNPSIALSGEVAYQSGCGKFLQVKDRYDYQKLDADRNFDLKDRAFEEGQRQFNHGKDVVESLLNHVAMHRSFMPALKKVMS